MSPVLTIDLETRSTVDLRKTGVHVYAESPDTDVHCAAWAIDDAPVQLWKRGDPVPDELAEHVMFGGACAAWNASFEIAIWTHVLTPRHGWPLPKLEQWRCSMVSAYAMALPGALENAAPAVGLDIAKDQAGKRLMLAMSKPRRPKKDEPKNAILWREDPADLDQLFSYCKNDVEVERGIRARLVNLRKQEQTLWHLDQCINARGVPVDAELCRKALAVVEAHAEALDKCMAQVTQFEVTGCTNIGQLKTFVKSRIPFDPEKEDNPVEALDREAIVEMLIRPDLPDEVRAALELRQEAGKASVSKISALLNGMSADGRARGLLQFHAARPGRWAGRRYQPQNIVRPKKGFDIEGAIDVLLHQPTKRALDTLDTFYGPPLSCVSYTLRGMVKAESGNKIIAADFSNIEGRVIAWLAGEHKKLDAFRAYDNGTGHDLYKIMAGSILGKRPEDIDDDERQTFGKVPELACGFQGGVGAFQAMAHTYGVKISDETAKRAVTGWRDTNPNIVQLWYGLEEAAIEAVDNPGRIAVCGKLRFRMTGSFLWLSLPSGRCISYPYPRVMTLPTPWGQQKDMLTFKAVPNISNARKIVHSDKSNSAKWARISTYGGDISQTATEGVARDCLAEGMTRLEAEGYPIILHAHDENTAECAEDFGSVGEFEEIMCASEAWAAGLPVAASGFSAERYRK